MMVLLLTYVGKDECADEIIDTHLRFMLDHDVVVPVDNEKLPSFYWLPTLHKNPYSYRFIAASSACTTKPLSKLLIPMLETSIKTLQSILRRYRAALIVFG